MLQIFSQIEIGIGGEMQKLQRYAWGSSVEEWLTPVLLEIECRMYALGHIFGLRIDDRKGDGECLW
jgi:hypothetical protein